MIYYMIINILDYTLFFLKEKLFVDVKVYGR